MATLPTKPSDDFGWTEPESAASVETPPKYPYNNIQQSESGHSFEMDDTPAAERVRLQHRSGTFIEMHPNGDEVHKVYGDGYEITIKNKNVLIKGVCNITVEGDSILHVKGNRKELVDGNYSLVVKGDYSVATQGETSIMSKDDMTVGCGNMVDGSLHIMTGNHLRLAGDLSVDGEIVAKTVTTSGRIDAVGGVSAGFPGFVSVLGGLSIGLPAAVPGTISCVGQVIAPVGDFGVMNAVLMTDLINSVIFDFHIHGTWKGPTTPPFMHFV